MRSKWEHNALLTDCCHATLHLATPRATLRWHAYQSPAHIYHVLFLTHSVCPCNVSRLKKSEQSEEILYFPISRSLLYIPGVRVSSCRGYRWPTAASIGRVAMRWNTSFPPSPPTAAWPGSASRTLRNSPSPCADITQWMREIKLKIQCLQ